MKRLTLIRHAMSSHDFPLLGDFQRPLSARGRRDVPPIAQRLAAQITGPVAMVASPATRTLTTAQGFAEAFGLDDTDIRLEPAIYEASPGTLLALVNALPEPDAQVLLIGHNPGLTDLGRLLAGRNLPAAEMPPGACLTLTFDAIERWSDVTPGAARIDGWLTP